MVEDKNILHIIIITYSISISLSIVLDILFIQEYELLMNILRYYITQSTFALTIEWFQTIHIGSYMGAIGGGRDTFEGFGTVHRIVLW